ncbi:MAG: CoA transferase [Betaproteobacteria bacterium]|nr:CoA transferase [Betaproteobacteria bacterium]
MPHIPASSALSSLRVLDLSRVRAGPTCVKQFADFGADVIKIESREPDPMNGPRHGFDMQNLHRNKRSMILNFKSSEGMAVFERLVKISDVVVENFRPDVKQRLGIDYASLKKMNKRIILASISGFGQDGPYAERPGFDQIAQGMGGLMMVTGHPGEGPMRAGAAVADMTAGFLASIGIFTALYERQLSGEGQWVQSSLLQAQIALLDFQAARYLMKGEVPEQVGNDHPTFMPQSAYRTSDGHINIAASGQPMWGRLCKAIGREDLREHPAFATDDARSKNRRQLNEALNSALGAKTSAEWIEELNAVSVPCGPVYSMDQVFADPQVRHLEAAAPVLHPQLGEVRLVNQAVKLSRTPASMARPTPEAGEHTDEILASLGYSETEIASLHAVKAV